MDPLKKLFLGCLALLAGTLLFADSSSKLNIVEQDGTPSTFPYKLKVTNGSLTDNGDGTASLTTGGGGGSTVILSSGVGFGAADNTVITDTRTFSWDNTAKQLSIGVIDPNFFSASLLLGQSTSGAYSFKIGVGADAIGVSMSTTTNKTFKGFDVSNSTVGVSFSVLKDYGGFVWQAIPVGVGNANIFPMTFRTSNVGQVTSVSLVIQSTGVAISSDVYVSGTGNFIGTGDGEIKLTVGVSTYTVTGSSAIPAVGSYAIFSDTWGHLTRGATPATLPGGNAFNVQYASANGTQFAGSDNLQNNGSTVTFSGVYNIAYTNISSETASGVNFDYTGSTITVSSGTITLGTFVSAVVSTTTYNGVTAASLGASAPNGTLKYCSDCTVTTPATCLGVISAACVCTGSGSGAFAKRLNATWYCN